MSARARDTSTFSPYTFRLTEEDFEACKRSTTTNYIQPVRRKFNNQLKPQLIMALGEKFKEFQKTESPVSPYVARSYSRFGGGHYRGNMWLGMAHKKYDDPRNGVQFQFGIRENSIYYYGLWIEGENYAKNARNNAVNIIINNSHKFIELIKQLPDKYKIHLLSSELEINVNEMNEEDIGVITSEIIGGDYFHIRYEISPQEGIYLGTSIVKHISDRFLELLPLYNFLADIEVEEDIKVVETKSYFILRTGGGEYEDVPESIYHFREGIPGYKQLLEAENKGEFVYYESQKGGFWARGRIGSIRQEKRNGEMHYFMNVEKFEEIGPITFDSVEGRISFKEIGQAGIRKISRKDFEAITKFEGEEILHLLYKIAWHPGDYKGNFCGDANSTACEAFNYIRKNKATNPCSPGVFHCIDEHEAFSDNSWRVKIHPPRIDKHRQLSNGRSLLFLIAPMTKSRTKYRLIGFYTIKNKIIENEKVSEIEADKNLSSKFDLSDPKLEHTNSEIKNLFDISDYYPRVSYEFINNITAKKVLKQIYEIHKIKDITDPDIKLYAMEKTIENLNYIPYKERIIPSLKRVELITHLEKLAASHLLSGKNLILYGPPGTGKTRLAKRLAEKFCGERYTIVTANAEWSTFNVVGGDYITGQDEGKGLSTNFRKGFLAHAAYEGQNKPYWVIIDELNRANLDLAFGEAFTLLDIEHRKKMPLVRKRYDDMSLIDDLFLPSSFRLISTLNSYDRSALFSLGYAFRRRFAFVEVSSPYHKIQGEDTLEIEGIDWQLLISDEDEVYRSVYDEVSRWIEQQQDPPIIDPDGRIINLDSYKSKLFQNHAVLKTGSLNLFKLFHYLSEWMTQQGIVSMGYAQTVDAIKFVHAFLCLEDFNPRNLFKAADYAFLSYYLPHLEYFLPKVRRARIGSISGEEESLAKLEELKKIILANGLKMSNDRLEEIKDNLEKFGDISVL